MAQQVALVTAGVAWGVVELIALQRLRFQRWRDRAALPRLLR